MLLITLSVLFNLVRLDINYGGSTGYGRKYVYVAINILMEA